MQLEYDLLIGGGGLAGNCLALALKNCGLKIALIEAVSRQQLQNAAAGDRALALSAGTVLMLESLGVWSQIKANATAIKKIHISDQGHFGKMRLSAEKQGVEALGYVIAARKIETPIAQMIEEAGIKQFCPAQIESVNATDKAIEVHLRQEGILKTLSAQLLVGADGGQSTIRGLLNIAQQKKTYGQTALITTIKSSFPHQHVAYERFTSSGPLALLPTSENQSAIVWTRTHSEAKQLLSASESDFTEQLQACFGYHLGELTLTAPRIAFPLTLVRAEKIHAQRSVIIGNAAHQLHPVAGQGFNLGLRDVIQLAEMLIKQHQNTNDIGTNDFLQRYANSRQKDHQKVIGFTDNVVKIFSNQWLALSAIRNTALTLLDHIPIAKHALAKQAMGFDH
jgi:2-octaprenyl-6-methoxyphenol hydroxylase